MGERLVVFWDFDGTLAERLGGWANVLHDALVVNDSPTLPSTDVLAAGLPRGFPDWAPGALRRYPSAAEWWNAASPPLASAYATAGVASGVADEAIAVIPRIYYEPTRWKVADGAHAALTGLLSAGLSNVILSNHAPELPELVAALGFEPLVERTITSASLGAEKPSPEVFYEAMRLTGAAHGSWMIGDNPITDVAGARAVGLNAILVHQGDAVRPSCTVVDAAALVRRSLLEE